MRKMVRRCLLGVCLVFVANGAAAQPAASAADYDTRKITDSTYIFRFGGTQSMFVVTPDGVIATDPISPQAAKVYLQEIRKITQAPVRYVVYSHHHLDHVAGGAPFKEAGATFVAHRQARAALLGLNHPDVVIPDLVVDDQTVLTVGGTRVELHFVGKNHTDNTLVTYVPKDRIIFAVDFLLIKELPFRGLPDTYVLGYVESIDRTLALDWDRMIAGHSRQGGIGTKDDIRAFRGYVSDLFAAVKQAAAEGKCEARAMAEIKLPQYADWGRPEFLPQNIERLCYFFRLGWL
jgi:glyoxylase-like metal-dependent hydrolase (beta-lactamase superfamily II)